MIGFVSFFLFFFFQAEDGIRGAHYGLEFRRVLFRSQALHVDPTTVSRRVSSLEADLQQTLFERAPAGFVLTAAGRALVPHAETMAAAAARIHAREGPSDLSGQLRISVSEGLGSSFIAPRLTGFVAAHPEIEIDLVASSGFLNPSRREADMAVLLARPRKGPLRTRKLADYSLGLYAPADRPDWQEDRKSTRLNSSH